VEVREAEAGNFKDIRSALEELKKENYQRTKYKCIFTSLCQNVDRQENYNGFVGSFPQDPS